MDLLFGYMRIMFFSALFLLISFSSLLGQANFLEPDDLNFYKNESKVHYELNIKYRLYPDNFREGSLYYERAILILPNIVNEREKGLFFYAKNNNGNREHYLMLRTTENLFSRSESETGRKIIVNEIIKPFKNPNLYNAIKNIIKEETSNTQYQYYEFNTSTRGDKFIFIDYSLSGYRGGILWENRTNDRSQLLIDMVDELLLQMSGYVRVIQNNSEIDRIVEKLNDTY